MISYAFVKLNGLVSHVCSPALDDMYVDGQFYGDEIARALPADADHTEVISSWVWSNGAWSTRPASPGPHYLFENGSWVFNSESFMAWLRMERDTRLGMNDWTQMPDSQLTDSEKAEWATYRQALRDVPANNANINSLDEVSWPTEPGG